MMATKKYCSTLIPNVSKEDYLKFKEVVEKEGNHSKAFSYLLTLASKNEALKKDKSSIEYSNISVYRLEQIDE